MAELLRGPGPRDRAESNLGAYLDWLRLTRDLDLATYDELWRWSVEDLEGFWGSLWDYFAIEASVAPTAVLESRAMPGAKWFPGARLSYPQHVLRGSRGSDQAAVVARSQTRPEVVLTLGELREQVAGVRRALVALGVGRGDRVVAYLPNIPETLVAFLATASLGAVWASCAPEFGARSVIERFAQVEPKVLLAVSGYVYGDKPVDRTGPLREVVDALPTLQAVVHVPYLDAAPAPDLPVTTLEWPELLAGPSAEAELAFEQVPFDHPLFVLFSSGTTGKPKAIVHGHGGILLEHLKNHTFSWDVRPSDVFMWFSTTAWMMWNILVSALLARATVVMVDGNPLHPGTDAQWRIAAETGATFMGASPALIMASRAEGLNPASEHDLSRLRQLGVAGSPLAAEGYRWAADRLPGVLLNVGSGGTDICTGMVQGSPLQPVWVGEISGACLGVSAMAFDEEGRRIVGSRGELVITEPMPSMPVGFWGDPTGERYAATYFARYPGVWQHGDWVRFSDTGSCLVIGRSDATLNRGGVRLGTAEFYQVLEEHPAVRDSLVVHLEDPAGGLGELVLYVALREGRELDDGLVAELSRLLRESLSPRHVPDVVRAVPAVPVNRTGKKLEVPVKRILQGQPVTDVMSTDVLADPTTLDPFVAHAAERLVSH